MKGLLKKFLSGAVFGLGLTVSAMLIGSAVSATLPLFTGPTGTNPANFPIAMPDLNALIQSVNTNMQPATSLGFAANGSVATVLGSLGPTGSHTAVQEWLTVIDASGNIRYVPGF